MITNPAAVCSPSTVDLTAAAVTAGSTGAGTLSYWTDAAGTVSLATPTAVSTSGTYYIKSTIGSCTDIESVVVTVNPTPSLVITNPAAVCVPATVDLTAAAVTAGSTGGGILSYWTDVAGTIPLASPSSVSTSGTYYIKSTVGTCTDIESVVATISPSPSLVITNPAAVCSPATVDITNATITMGSTPGTTTLSYWSNIGATVPLANFTAIAISGTYYIMSSINGCDDIKPVVVTINKTPAPSVSPVSYCLNDTASSLTATGSNLLWYTTSTGGTGSGTAPTPITTTVGSVTYYVSQTLNGCESDRAAIVVRVSQPPVSAQIPPLSYFSEVNTITVYANPPGVYEYSLNGGPFQSSNIFNNVPPGTHNVVVRNECAALPPVTTVIVDYPRYFTPNADGYHDTWNIPFLSTQKDSKIDIFDRFGKLITVIQPSGNGWDGTYSNQQLPSTDYWFVVYYKEDGVSKTHRAHFAMKR